MQRILLVCSLLLIMIGCGTAHTNELTPEKEIIQVSMQTAETAAPEQAVVQMVRDTWTDTAEKESQSSPSFEEAVLEPEPEPRQPEPENPVEAQPQQHERQETREEPAPTPASTDPPQPPEQMSVSVTVELVLPEPVETVQTEPEPTPPPPTEPDPEPKPEPAFDIDYWVSYAKSYASGIGLALNSEAVDCWDNPIIAGSRSMYLERDIQGMLNKYNRDEDITDVWVWARPRADGNYDLFIGYA